MLYWLQDVALRDISHVLHQYLTGWHPDNKPLVLLFAGPSRSGKTEAAQQIAKILTKQPMDSQFFLNMGQFALEHDVANLNGAPQGYTGSDKDARLAALAGRENPVVVLDEIEKAHARARDFFLSVFDKGHFSTTAGKVIDCKSAIFIMTSNIGQKLLTERADHVRGLSDEARRLFEGQEIQPQFKAHGWRPEFLTRIRMCVPFLPFSSEQEVEVAKHFLKVSIMYLMSQRLLANTACSASALKTRLLLIAVIMMQKAMETMPFVRKNNLVITWSPAMVQEVARSYEQHPNEGFNAFGKSAAYAAAQDKLSLIAEAKLSEAAAYVRVDYIRGEVVVQDLLGQPNASIKAQVLETLQSVLTAANDDKELTLVQALRRLKSLVTRQEPTLLWTLVLFSIVQCIALVFRKQLQCYFMGVCL